MTKKTIIFLALACSGALQAQRMDNVATHSRYIQAVDEYLAAVKRRTERERLADRRVTGVFSGAYAINPVTGKEIPVWISDYVLSGYGTGAIMAVPAHDQRDYEIAKKHGLDMIQVLEGDISEKAMEDDAKHINSSFADGLNIEDAKKQPLINFANWLMTRTK